MVNSLSNRACYLECLLALSIHLCLVPLSWSNAGCSSSRKVGLKRIIKGVWIVCVKFIERKEYEMECSKEWCQL